MLNAAVFVSLVELNVTVLVTYKKVQYRCVTLLVLFIFELELVRAPSWCTAWHT